VSNAVACRIGLPGTGSAGGGLDELAADGIEESVGVSVSDKPHTGELAGTVTVAEMTTGFFPSRTLLAVSLSAISTHPTSVANSIILLKHQVPHARCTIAQKSWSLKPWSWTPQLEGREGSEGLDNLGAFCYAYRYHTFACGRMRIAALKTVAKSSN